MSGLTPKSETVSILTVCSRKENCKWVGSRIIESSARSLGPKPCVVFMGLRTFPRFVGS